MAVERLFDNLPLTFPGFWTERRSYGPQSCRSSEDQSFPGVVISFIM